MPTNQNAYNSRVTDESLEKKFRDTFKSQGGAELVDDLYASGVIVPVVDFTAAAEGSALRQDLQTAWDISTTNVERIGSNTNVTIINSTGFWKIRVVFQTRDDNAATDATGIYIDDGAVQKTIFLARQAAAPAGNSEHGYTFTDIVFLAAGEILKMDVATDNFLSVSYRQIADVNGNLTNPLGFTSS